ncbi:VOC family protein [Sporocytophaga myxococcoides]|uniref:VOC family protein n=1 Tax=Sporocytophaga myxococcoides TaxID=153721 RepID=UPI00040A20D5|nr:VOC family protein [Sporocytophaga myxococcoides]
MSKKISSETNAINWFEIAVKDISRAKKFYELILETELSEMEMMGMKMAMFPSDSSNGKVGGALVQSEMHTPSAAGSVVYLNGNPDIQLVLNRIEKSGGKITMPKTLIDEQTGYMAFFTDTEGNNIGLHSNN